MKELRKTIEEAVQIIVDGFVDAATWIVGDLLTNRRNRYVVCAIWWDCGKPRMEKLAVARNEQDAIRAIKAYSGDRILIVMCSLGTGEPLIMDGDSFITLCDYIKEHREAKLKC